MCNMNTKIIISVFVAFLYSTNTFSQEQSDKFQLQEISNERKHSYSVFRTDYYICTGIAYAKSVGMTVQDFAKFVASKHSMTSSRDTSIAAIMRTLHMVTTTYPSGIFKILNQSETKAYMIWNRPYASYFKSGPVLGVSLDEFETYLYGHIDIMTKRIGVNFNYNIKGDTVYGNLSRYR